MLRSLQLISVLTLTISPLSTGYAMGETLNEREWMADNVAVAHVIETHSDRARNSFGADVIVTHVQFEVERTLKGTLSGLAEITVEGGTLDGWTFDVSDIPRVRKGDQVIVSMDDGPDGPIPYREGGGLRLLKSAGHDGVAKSRLFAMMTAKWKQSPVLYYVNPQNNDVSPEAALRAIQRAAETWSTSSRANFKFQYAGLSQATEPSNNGKNEVFFRNEVAQTGGLTTATTYSWWDSEWNLVDSDLVFWDAAFRFHAPPSGIMDCKEGAYIQNVATHELGHVLGLRHSDVPGSTMAPAAPACDRSAETLSTDDIAGIEALYPPKR